MKNQYQEIEEALRMPDGSKFEIPVQGCLGLMALGDIGLIAWRLKKQEFMKEQQKSNSNNNL